MSGGLIINGTEIHVPGVRIVNYLEDPRLLLRGSTRPRAHAIRGIILHTESGDEPHELQDGRADDYDHGAHLADVDNSDTAAGHPHSQHLTIACDCTVYQFADLAATVTYQAQTANEYTIGIEYHDPLVEQRHRLYRGQLTAGVAVIDVITRELTIQRQVQEMYAGYLPVLADGTAYGIYGHCDQSPQRGLGDPGDWVRRSLIAAGYDGLGYRSGRDRLIWQARQRWLNEQGAQLEVDGLPGPATVAAVKRFAQREEQRRTGVWIVRPGD